MQLNCLNCKYQPEWDYQTVTLKYNHTVSMGRCGFTSDYDIPPCFDEHKVCVVVPDNPDSEIQFGMMKHGTIAYMHSCGGWRPSDKYLEIPDLTFQGGESAQFSV